MLDVRTQLAQPQIDRLEAPRRIPHPEGQDGPLDLDPLGAQHLGLPIERKMPGVFADQDVGQILDFAGDDGSDSLPTDADALRALLLAERARHGEERERWMAIIAELQRHRFGRRSERLDPDQLALTLEDVEQMLAAADAAGGGQHAAREAGRSAQAAGQSRRVAAASAARGDRDRRRGQDLRRRGGLKHRIGEDVSERLDMIPAQFRVVVARRPRYGCAACAGEVVQAPAPARLIEGGLPTEATVAQVLVAKYADHLPLYRQAQIYARQGVALDRSTLADWVGRAAFCCGRSMNGCCNG